jgi:hypothetical protein
LFKEESQFSSKISKKAEKTAFLTIQGHFFWPAEIDRLTNVSVVPLNSQCEAQVIKWLMNHQV